MRRNFTLGELKLDVIDHYHTNKSLSLFRINSREIIQLTALYHRLYKAGRLQFAEAAEADELDTWEDSGGPWLGLWRSENCYMEVLRALATDFSGDDHVLERKLLQRYDHRYYSVNTANALGSFIQSLRESVDYAQGQEQARQIRQERSALLLNTVEPLRPSSSRRAGVANTYFRRLLLCLPGINRGEQEFNEISLRLGVINRLLEVSDEVCPISTDAIVQRVELSQCHHVFEKDQITAWYHAENSQNHKPACPCCREPFSLDQIIDRPKKVDEMLTELKQWAENVITASVVEARSDNNLVPLPQMRM